MLFILQSGKHLRYMPLPWRSNIDEIKIITTRETLEIVFAISIDCRRLLTSLLNQLRSSNTLIFDDIANGIHNHLIDRQELAKHACSTQTNADHSDSNNVSRFKLN